MGQEQNTSALLSLPSQDIIFTSQKHEWSKSTAWKLKPSSTHLCFSQIKLEKHCGLHDSCSVGTAFSQSITLSVYISHLHLSVFPVFIAWSKEMSLQIPAKSHNPCQRGARRSVHLHHAQTSGCDPSSLLKGPVQSRWKLWGRAWSPRNSHSLSSFAAHGATLWFVWQLYSYLGLALISVAGSSIFQAVVFLFYDCPSSAGITIKIQGKKNLSWINSGQIVILHGLTQLPVLNPLNLAPSACRSGLQPLFQVLGGDMCRYFAWGVTHLTLLSKISSFKTSWVFITFRRYTSWTSSAVWLVLVQNKNVSKTHASLQRISHPGYNASPGTNPEWQLIKATVWCESCAGSWGSLLCSYPLITATNLIIQSTNEHFLLISAERLV